MSLLTSRLALGASLSLLAAGTNAAVVDFTIPTSGFSVESYTAVALTDPSGAIAGGNITSEAGFQSIRLDVDGINLDILIDDIGVGNPYFDAQSGGKPGGLGSCRVLTGSAQCTPNNDDNITIGTAERVSLSFQNNSGQSQSVLFGDFIFRDDNHNLITGNIQVTHDGGSYLLGVVGGIGDLSVIGASDVLVFNDQAGSEQSFYISGATLNVVPIPAAAWLFGSALAGLGWMRRKQTV